MSASANAGMFLFTDISRRLINGFRPMFQCSSLRSEVSLMRVKLHSSESEKEKLSEELVAAHTRIDRLQSKTVATLNNNTETSSEQTESGGGGSGGGEVKKDEGSPTPSSPSVSGSVIRCKHWWELYFLITHSCLIK